MLTVTTGRLLTLELHPEKAATAAAQKHQRVSNYISHQLSCFNVSLRR